MTKRKLITADDIIALNPCWLNGWHKDGAERIRALVGNGVTGTQIATDRRVSLDDREWVLLRLFCDRDVTTLRLWAAGLIMDQVHRIKDPYEEALTRAALERVIQGLDVLRDDIDGLMSEHLDDDNSRPFTSAYYLYGTDGTGNVVAAVEGLSKSDRRSVILRQLSAIYDEMTS